LPLLVMLIPGGRLASFSSALAGLVAVASLRLLRLLNSFPA
jgi:hypothetical protein